MTHPEPFAMTPTPERHPKIGIVYQFNRARAKVIGLTADEVVWRDFDAKVPTHASAHHSTPRWYFERHATFIDPQPQPKKRP